MPFFFLLGFLIGGAAAAADPRRTRRVIRAIEEAGLDRLMGPAMRQLSPTRGARTR